MHTGRSESSENLARKGQKEASCLLLNPCPQLLQSPIDITLVPRGNLHLSLSLAVKHNGFLLCAALDIRYLLDTASNIHYLLDTAFDLF
jgi:hypothetical protein